jgi:hypothetical protein
MAAMNKQGEGLTSKELQSKKWHAPSSQQQHALLRHS